MQTQTTEPATACLPWDWALDVEPAADRTPDRLDASQPVQPEKAAGTGPAVYLPPDWND